MEKCEFCDYRVPRKRRADIIRHVRVSHPEQTALIAGHEARLAARRADFEKRAKIQCFLCAYAGVKVSNMRRHYENRHDYDASKADAKEAPEQPDGALCPECGAHFVNSHAQIRHLLKAHSRSTGEQCLYCPFR